MFSALPRVALTGVVFLIGFSVSRADPFAIELKLEEGKSTKTAHVEPPVKLGDKPRARAILEVKAGAKITVKWTLACTDAKNTYKDVTVHFFVVKEEKAGQTAVPKLDKDVPAETALSMDFKDKDKSEGELTLVIDKPGAYLVRLETLGTVVGGAERESYAALDLVVR